MTYKNREYIFHVKNLLVINTSRHELDEILTDLQENVQDNSQDGVESLLDERFGSPIHFVKELKGDRIKTSILKSSIAIILTAAAYVGFLIYTGSANRYVILPRLQIPTLVLFALFTILYLWLSGDTLPICRRLASTTSKSRKAFIIMLAISSVLCLPELYLQTIGVKQLLEYGEKIGYKWNTVILIPNILETCAVVLIALHCLIAAIALVRYLIKAETYMAGVIIQSLLAVFATVWTNYGWFGTFSTPALASDYLFTCNWLLSFAASVIFTVLYYKTSFKEGFS